MANTWVDSDFAWLAGFFDGEGSVGIYATGRTTEGGGKRAGKRGLFIHVSLVQADPTELAEVQKRYGGSLVRRKQSHLGGECWQWGANSKKAYAFLADIIPYLRYKKARAEIAMRFQEGKGRPGVRLTDARREEEQAARFSILALNKVG